MEHRTEHPTYLFESNDKKLWIGTDDGYLCYDLSSGRFIREKDACGMVMSVRESPDGKVWISTKSAGLYCINKNSGSSKRYPSLKGITDISFVGNDLWLASENGRLISLDYKNNKVNDLTERYGIGNNSIISLQKDGEDNIWVISHNMVIKIIPQKEFGYCFEASELGLERIMTAVVTDGKLLAGGIGGISMAVSDIEVADSGRRPPEVTKLECEGDTLLSFPDNQINIASDCKMLKIYVSSFDHISPSKSEFRYRLKGFDDTWRNTGAGQNILTYKNLPSGHYALELSSLTPDGVWLDSEEALYIYKQRPFWFQWWMIVLYLALCIAIIVVILIFIRRHYAKRSKELLCAGEEMLKTTRYLESSVSLPQPEYGELDRMLLDNVTKTIEANMEAQDFDINKLASCMNMSRSTLTRKVKSITGKNPGDLIQEIKMKHACQYLKNGEYTVTEIADKIGYDRRYFTAIFKRKFGMTPREYMQNKSDTKSDEHNSNDYEQKN